VPEGSDSSKKACFGSLRCHLMFYFRSNAQSCCLNVETKALAWAGTMHVDFPFCYVAKRFRRPIKKFNYESELAFGNRLFVNFSIFIEI